MSSASACDAAGQPAVGQHRRVDAAHHAAQVAQRADVVSAGLAQQPAGGLGVGADQLLGQAEAHAERDEPGLGAVVQVALDPADLGGAVVEGLGAGGRHLLDPALELARPGCGRGGCARPPRRPGPAPAWRTTRRPAADRRARPGATTGAPVEYRAPSRWMTGATRSATGRTDITKPPVAENHRDPTSRQRAGSVSQLTGRVTTLSPVVSAYAVVMVSPSSWPLSRRCSAVRPRWPAPRRPRGEADGDQAERHGQDREDAERQRGAKSRA